MADKTDSDSRPTQISKDMQGSTNPVPLSPQWLFPKPGENKSGTSTGEVNFSPHSAYVVQSDPPKSPRMGDDVSDQQKKIGVFKPSVMKTESAGHNRWREEERDTNSSTRWDRSRVGDGDDRKVDRWTPGGRHFGEPRRVPLERVADLGNRGSNYDQHRDGKWNTRCGSDTRDTDLHEKRSDFIKDVEYPSEKRQSNLGYHNNEQREGDNYRPWRPNLSLSQGRVDPSHHLDMAPNKQGYTVSHGWGRGENAPTSSPGQGRMPSLGSHMDGVSSHIWSEKVESIHNESSPLRYSRDKLLDVYKVTDLTSSSKILGGAVQIPLLVQEETLEPLAFCVPSAEEMVILKGIDNGEILSSGAPQGNKDGSAGRNSTEFMQSRKNQQGSQTGMHLRHDNYRDETIDDKRGRHSKPFYERHIHSSHFNTKFEVTQDSERFSDLKLNAEGKWRPSYISDRPHVVSKGFTTMPMNAGSNIGWSDPHTDLADERHRSLTDSSYTKSEGQKQQHGNDQLLKRHDSVILDKSESDLQKLPQPSPENLVLYYKDPHGEIQGPFSGGDIIGWFEAGYFGIDLLVRLAGAPTNVPFSQLGDIMPHLCPKPRPPPGFGTPKPNVDVSTGMNLNASTNVLSGPTENDSSKSGQRYNPSSTCGEAENRFLESLMSGSMSNAPMEKFVHSEGDNMYALAKKMSLERQTSLPNSYWSAKEANPVVPTPDVVHDNALQHQMSLLQGMPDRSAGMNSGWSNFPSQGGLGNLQSSLEMHNAQRLNTQAAFGGIQQPRLPAQNPSLYEFMGQTWEKKPTSILAPPGISQDPQVLGLLQQQYLLQLQAQSTLPPQQLLVLEKLLLLKKQEQEQQQLAHQKQLLSQILANNHSSEQHIGEHLSYAQSQKNGISTGNLTTIDLAHLQPPHALFTPSTQNPVPDIATGNLATTGNAHSQPSHALYDLGTLNQVPDIAAAYLTTTCHAHTQPPHALFTPCTQSQVPAISTGNLTVGRAHLQPPHALFTPGTQNQIPAMEEDRASDYCALPTTISLDMANRNVSSETSSIHLPHQLFGAHHKSESTEPATVMNSVAVPKFTPPSGHDIQFSLDKKSEHVQPIPECLKNQQCEGDQRAFELSVVNNEMKDVESSSLKDTKSTASCEVKKSIEKKPKKKKSAKMQAVDSGNGSSQTKNSKSSESKGIVLSHVISEAHGYPTALDVASELETLDRKTNKVVVNNVNAQPEGSENDGTKVFEIEDDGEPFIEIKNTEKNRKKSAKAKAASSKNSAHVVLPVEISEGSSSLIENKSKSGSRQSQTDKDALPAVPSGPSLGDFVLWKAESANPSAPTPAWSDSGKIPKPTSLRDILKEQGKKAPHGQQQHIQVPAPQKRGSTQPAVGGATETSWSTEAHSWSLTASSPSKTATPIQISTREAPQENIQEDDLFWGPVEHMKQDGKQSGFPLLGNHGSWGSVKGGIPSGSFSKQNSIGRTPAPGQSTSLAGNKVLPTKHSEATDFRKWCESECERLLGSRDTSILEYCLTQSRYEAEMLLIQNMGSFDPEHHFINQFLSYKDFLASDVLAMAFENLKDLKVSTDKGASEDATSDAGPGSDAGGAWNVVTRGGEKKKGKKGK
ncbi:unnamed protein product [Cuscuta epithymum]|uniref:GYF domain-containing protein n=1 Tax=Cuscuta epithymum TaxID=186058 RepID=A0AAV0F8M5_9ASTE|nr:unnamed protein product [Cuscuta epithymum]CAH9131826.1 unnamed protein product [Cuscuta epithymum]